MATALHIRTTVLPGQRIEIEVPGLPVGEPVEVFVVPGARAPDSEPRQRSALDVIRSVPPEARLFHTPEEVDTYLAEERSRWDR